MSVVTIVPQIRPEHDVDVTTETRVTYWYRGPFRTEGPWDETSMEHAKETREEYREKGWWERKTTSTTTVVERL